MPTANAGQTARVMVVFPNVSGLARDQFVNTFHFYAPTLDEGLVGWLRDKVADFYNTNHGTNIQPGAVMSGFVDRAKPVEVKCYDLGDARPRPPHTASFDLVAPVGQGYLPNETAITVSYYADRNIPRHRGRIFFGPLDRYCLATGVGDVLVNDNVRQGLNAALADLALQVHGGTGAVLGIWSEMDQVLRYPLGGGWVDNAFDTVRKRGARATQRTSWHV